MLNNRREGSFVGQVDRIARLTKKKLKVFQIKTFIDIGNKANIINADYESILSSGQKRQEQNNNAENNLIRDGLINKLNLPMQTTEQ